jgi:hypothetical protein
VATSIISYQTLYNLHCPVVPKPDEEKLYPKGVVAKALKNVAFQDDGLIQYKAEVMLRIFEEDDGTDQYRKAGQLIGAQIGPIPPQLDRVVRRMDQILLGSQVPLGRLDGGMSQEHLNLLKLAAGSAAQLGACAAQVVRRDTGNANRRRVLPEHPPDDLLAQAIARHSIGPVTARNRIMLGKGLFATVARSVTSWLFETNTLLSGEAAMSSTRSIPVSFTFGGSRQSWARAG